MQSFHIEKIKEFNTTYGKKHGPTYNKLFKEGLSGCFQDASSTNHNFVVFLSDFTATLCGK